MIFIVSQKNLPNIILQKKFHTLAICQGTRILPFTYSSLHQVRYTKDRFNISKKDILEGRKDIIDKTVCSKADVWSYEKEWRIVTENYIKTRPSKVDPKTRCVLYLKDNIKAFYLGAKINEKEKSEIIEFAKKNNRIVYQMILSANTYELRAERIDNV